MSRYVCYDIRGIQRSIFAVPKLKYIVGGSSLIDKFDRETVPEIAKQLEGELVFAGGGRGTLLCGSEQQARALSKRIVSGVHEIGLDVRVGHGTDPAQAATNFRTYPQPIGDLTGEPCAVSGLLPVPLAAKGKSGLPVHPTIQMRARQASEDRVGREILRMVADDANFPKDLRDSRCDPSFIRNVNPGFDDSPVERTLAERGQAALGSRNRWALIAMDGNNIGLQHDRAREMYKTEPDRHHRWLGSMSRAIDAATRGALAFALARATKGWWDGAGGAAMTESVVLPFRPLIAGGDDLLLLTRCSLAMQIVKDICAKFSELSVGANRDFGGDGLWLATGGELSISAGVLYLPVTFPLASAITYAESLLGSAKGRGRRIPPGQAAPAAVDWDSITEGAIDTPAERRNRELRFTDPDDPGTEVILTCRPWSLAEMQQRLEPIKKELAKVPASIRHELLVGLRQGCWDRMRMLARMKKNHASLFDLLRYIPGEAPGGGWLREGRVLRTAYPDAILLLEEEHRMLQGDPS